jgi:hypothetical protein
MSVSNNRWGHSHNEFVTGFRMQAQIRTLAADATLAVDAAPVLYIDPGGAARTVKLPLAAPEGKVQIIVNTADAAEAITVTDSADAAIAGGTIAQNQTAIYQKVGAVWLKMMEGAFA